MSLVVVFSLILSLTPAQEVRYLYAPLVLTHALELHSTWAALDNGGKESNPLARPWINNKPIGVALKSTSAVLQVLVFERLRKSHPKVAFFIAMGITIAQTVITIHNYRVH